MDHIESTNEGLRELALFAGAGGGILGGHLLGWRTICAVEWDAYARDVLVARQNDGCLKAFPIWDDVQTFDGRPWRGRVDVVSGGFPCQDISCAGKGAGIEGERSGLMWRHMARIIREVGPRFVFVENSPMLVGRTCRRSSETWPRWGMMRDGVLLGAIHAAEILIQAERIWIVAFSRGTMRLERDTKNRTGVTFSLCQGQWGQTKMPPRRGKAAMAEDGTG
jgi:DNA (cytosine-5)-methyltransferase 1